MSRYIEVSPLPAGTTLEEVREVFDAYKINRFTIFANKAFLEFQDVNDIETLDFAFDGGIVTRLGNAEIFPLA